MDKSLSNIEKGWRLIRFFGWFFLIGVILGILGIIGNYYLPNRKPRWESIIN